MATKADTQIVTLKPLHMGSGQVPFPPGTQLPVTQEHAEHLVADGTAVLAENYEAYLAEQEEKQRHEARVAEIKPHTDDQAH